MKKLVLVLTLLAFAGAAFADCPCPEKKAPPKKEWKKPKPSVCDTVYVERVIHYKPPVIQKKHSSLAPALGVAAFMLVGIALLNRDDDERTVYLISPPKCDDEKKDRH